MRPARIYALRFDADSEAAFRDVQRRRYRFPRVALFGVHALAFALSPLCNGPLFHAPERLHPLMVTMELGVVLPIVLLAILALIFRAPKLITQSLQTAAVLTLWCAALSQRYLAQTEGFDYPSTMLGIMVIAVALFGGYSCRRVSTGALLFLGLASGLEFALAGAGSNPLFESYVLLLMAVVAILGAYTIEVFARHAWVAYQYASSLARTDALTGLSNRHDFNRLFPRCLAQAARDRQGVGVLLLDIDHFKAINDQHGHPFGDEVLREVGRCLHSSVALRPLDLLARFGGEELVVVWYGIPQAQLPELAERVLDSLRQLSLPLPGSDRRLSITASGGAMWLLPSYPVLPEQVLRRTDELLYQAKAAGRDRQIVGEWQQPG